MARLLLLGVAVLIAVLLVRTLMYGAVAAPVDPSGGEPIPLDETAVLEHLSQAITFRTVSLEPPAPRDDESFEAFLDWLERTYPEVFEALEAERVGLSLLLTWPGSEPSLPPVLLAAHYDVVPVIAGTEPRWHHPPFAGAVADGYVWGRGALDNKNAVVGLMEAVSWLLGHDRQPKRTVYLSFGHDEEIGGEAGAAAVVEKLRGEDVHLAWSLDEGSFVFENMLPGVDLPIATINVAEKGSVTMRIIASGEGGHSSMPPQRTAVGRLARALVALEENPLPGGLEGLAAESFDAIAPRMDFLPRMMFANRWLFGPLVEAELESLPFANAMIRTTTAPTMLSGSPKVNVLPVEAAATVNFRVHPRDTVEGVVAYVESLVADDHVRVEAGEGNPASPVADARSEGFRLVAEAVRTEFPGTLVAPGLLVAATDTRHYGRIADNAYRFNPMIVTNDEVAGFHGTNERISTAGMIKGIRTYVRLLGSL